MLKNAISWFEIPVIDFDRAKMFYSAIYDYKMPELTMGTVRMGFMLHDQEGGGIGGAIVTGDGTSPSDPGVKIYLNAGNDLNTVLHRVEAAGGKIVQEKTEITPEFGFYATFRDTEGNTISLHSMS